MSLRLFRVAWAAALICWPLTQAAAGGVDASRIEYVMGTMLEVRVDAADSLTAAHALDTAFAVVHRLDSLLSNYLPDSDIARVVAGAPAPVAVADQTFEFVKRTLEFTALTQGAFDPTVGPVVRIWGFYTGDYRVPDSAAVRAALTKVGYKRVRLDSTRQTMALDSGMLFDPGATGKGFALERAGAKLRSMGLASFYFDFGGQIYREGADTVGIAIVHPRSDSAALSKVYFASGSVATSGDYERFFEHEGVRYAHVIDPRTGYPVPNRFAVSVFAPDPFTADGLSTALFVAGSDEGAALLRRFRGAGAVSVTEHNKVQWICADTVWRMLESR